jgi:transposase-like protein
MSKEGQEYVGCPACKQYNTVEFWDSHTRSELGIPEGQGVFLSAGADKENHEATKSHFNCPTCNENVEGVELL